MLQYRNESVNFYLGSCGELPVTPPTLTSCLALLLPSVNMSQLTDNLGVSLPLNATTLPGYTHLEFLKNLTKDVHFTATLERRWEEFTHYAQHPQVNHFVSLDVP